MTKYRLEKSLFKVVYKHFFEHLIYYVFALLCLFGLHYSQSTIPGLTKDFADTAAKSGLDSFPVWKFLLLAFLIIFFRTLSRLLFFYPARLQQKYLRTELISLIEKVHPSRYSEQSDGQIYQLIYNDFNRIRGMVGFGFLQIGNTVIAISVFYPKISNFEPKLLLAFTPLLMAIIIFTIIIWITSPNSKKAMDAQGELQNFLMETYKGKSSIKNYHSEKSFFESFINLSKREMRFFYKAGIGPAVSTPLIKLAFGISLLWGAQIIFENNLGASSLVFFSGFLFLVLEPLSFLSWIGIVISSGVMAWKRISKLLSDLETSSKSENEIKELGYKEKETNEFFDLKLFLWKKEVEVKILKNKWNIIIGETGVGKSYLLNSIADILKAKDCKINMVFQEPYLYNDTLGANIFLGKVPTEEDKRLAKELIKIFSLELLEKNDKEILDLELGENGKKVSGGQAKRIILIRSLFCDSDIYIWDDPFSSVDMIHEEQIINKIKEIESFKNKTFLLTSHRLSTIKKSNYLFFLDKNEGVKESGEVSFLLNNNTHTASYFEKQLV